MAKTFLFKAWVAITLLIALATFSQPFIRLHARAQARQEFVEACLADRAGGFPSAFCPNVRKSVETQPDGLAYAFEATNFPVLLGSSAIVFLVLASISFLLFWGTSALLRGTHELLHRPTSVVDASVTMPPSAEHVTTKPRPKNWWQGQGRRARTWMFFSAVWTISVVALTSIFDVLDAGWIWESGDFFSPEGIRLITLALLPWVGGLVWRLYERVVK
jgi:hypothetical protein